MGIGDELMMAGDVQRRARTAAGKYLMLDKRGAPRFHDVWLGHPNIVKPGAPHQFTHGYLNGRRPYIVDETKEQRTWREYAPEPAFIQRPEGFARIALDAKGYVLFAPAIKSKAPVNKAWPGGYWATLVRSNDAIGWMQIQQPEHADHVRGAQQAPLTPQIWMLAALISGARAVVCQEGAVHHIAAAVGTPAAVIRGGYISPDVTGYKGQVDLYVADERYPLGCGMRLPCAHCAEAMRSITPEVVLAALAGLLKATGR